MGSILEQAGHFAQVNGLKMYYESHGHGFPLVLIHGGGSTLETTFGRIIPELAKAHQVIAVEMQAHGRTEDIDRPLTFTQDADDLAELLNVLHIDQANIFGFSNGASTTLEFAIRHSKKANKIIVGSTMFKRSGAFNGFFDMMKHATFEEMPQPYKDAFLKLRPDPKALYQMFMRDVTRMQNFPDISEESMSAIKSPALIIAGNQDVVTMEHAVEMTRLIPHAQLVILPGGHGDYLGEITTPTSNNTEFAVVSILNDFLLT